MRRLMHSEGFWILVSLAVAAIVLAAGCGGDLPVASRLERTRVLGARVQVAAEPGRADALPGEDAAVEWLVAGPRTPGSLSWAFAVCMGVEGTCEDALATPVVGTGAPVLAPFTAPPSVDPLKRPLMVGAVCEGGTPALDGAGRPTCGGATDSANVARFQIPMPSAGEEPNHHPSLGDDALVLADAPWTAPATGDAGAPCAGTSALPVVTAGSEQLRLRLVTDAGDREAFVREPGQAATLEELQLSSYATAGEFEGSYALIPASDTRPDADFIAKWTPPVVKDVPAAGLVVHFHFVVRDGRGGLDWTHRALCVVAP